MSVGPLASNYDVLAEIFKHLSITKPFDITSRRTYRYWGPQPIDPWMNDKEIAALNEGRKTLLSAALSCKMISSIALDELWAAPRGGLYALLSLLSNLVVEQDSYPTYKFGHGVYKVQRYVC